MVNNDEHKYATFKIDKRQFKLNYIIDNNYYVGLTFFDSKKIKQIKEAKNLRFGLGRVDYKFEKGKIEVETDKNYCNKIKELMIQNNCLYYKFKNKNCNLVAIKFKYL